MRSLPFNLKNIFAPFACLLVAAFATWPVIAYAAAQEEKAAETTGADKIVADAISTLSKQSSIKADLRESVAIGTRRFIATGKYAQSGENQVRISLEIQPLEKTVAVSDEDGKKKASKKKKDSDTANSSILQVSDGKILWTQLTIGGKAEIQRKDIQEIAKAVAEMAEAGKANNRWTSPEQMMSDLGIGGVPALLVSMQKRMVFQGSREQEIDGKPFLVVQGRWNEEQLKSFGAKAGDDDPILANYLPEYVRLFFEKKTLVPRRIMFLKRHPDRKQRFARPMVTLDLMNVELNHAIDPDQFRFSADVPNQKDVTEDVIKMIKGAAEQAPAPNAAK